MKNFAGRIVLLCLNFGTGIVVARSLHAAGRGEQAAMALWPILVAGLATFGIPTAVNYCTRKNPERAGNLFLAAELCALAAGIAAMVLGMLLVPYVLAGYDRRVMQEAQILMIFTPQCALLYVLRAHLEAHAQFMRSLSTQIVPVIVTLGGLIVLRLSHSLDPWTAALAYYIPPAIQTGWLALRLSARTRIDVRCLPADARRLLGYGIRSYGSDVINALSVQLDLAVLVAFLSPSALGIYTVAVSLSRLVNVAQQSVVTVLFPKAAGISFAQAVALVERAARGTTAISALFGLALFALLPIAIPLVYGAGFRPVITILPVLLAEAVIGGCAVVLGQAFLATGRPGIVSLVQLVWLIVVLASLVIMVPRLGVIGAAFALLTAAVVKLGFLVTAYTAVLRVGVPRLIPDLAEVRDTSRMIGRLTVRAMREKSRLATAPDPLEVRT